MFVSIKPLHVSVFFYDHLQGVLRCCITDDIYMRPHTA